LIDGGSEERSKFVRTAVETSRANRQASQVSYTAIALHTLEVVLVTHHSLSLLPCRNSFSLSSCY